MKNLLLSIFKLPDFAAGQAPSQQIRRPFAANSQCGKLLAALEKGQKISGLTAFAICGTVHADRRLRDVRAYLKQNDRKLETCWVKTKCGARHMQYWLADPQSDRRKAKRGAK